MTAELNDAVADLLDEGDLDAALARVRIYTDANDVPSPVCACGVRILLPRRWNNTVLDLVNAVAEHQPTCESVKSDLRKAAADSIERSGFKTKADMHRALGGDPRAYDDPIVKEILAQLPEGPPTKVRVRDRVRIVEDAEPELVGLEFVVRKIGPDGTTAWLTKEYSTRVEYGVWCSISALEILTDPPLT